MAIVSVEPSARELSEGRWRPESFAHAVAALRQDGAVVLAGIVDRAHVVALRERMLADVPALRALREQPTQFVAGHVQQDPPPELPLLFRDVLVNDLAVAVTRELLGPGVSNGRYTGNTNLPGSGTQPVHYDEGQLWPGHVHPAHALVVNVPLVDMDERNGSIELWPGTHLLAHVGSGRGAQRIPEGELTARRALAPPVQPKVAAGSMLIRDMRLWHRGMPNHGDVPRPMLAMIHVCAWHRVGAMRLPAGAEGIVAHSELSSQATFHAGPIRYLDVNKAYDVAARAREAGTAG